MNQSNRTIEEKLAIVQQLRNASNSSPNHKNTDKALKTSKNTQLLQTSQNQAQTEEPSNFFAFIIVRLVICLILFGVIAFMGTRNPDLNRYINIMITTEENGNLIDFMSPFTYTLQENDESASDLQDNTDVDAPSVE